MQILRCDQAGALEPLGIEQNGRGLFRVAKPCLWAIGDLCIHVPVGFVTDGASIPWWGRWCLSPWGRSGTPAILHDYLLSLEDIPKATADWLFYGALKANGVDGRIAFGMYLAVRTRRKSSRMRKQDKAASKIAAAREAVIEQATPAPETKPEPRQSLSVALLAVAERLGLRLAIWAGELIAEAQETRQRRAEAV